VTGFVQGSLCALAVFAVLGLAAPFALAAKARKPHLAVAALLAAAWVITVLVYAAVMLP
jgi:hypothetical protein